MCGIVGLLLKKSEMRASLGQLVTPMLECMSTRGPDSAGLAVFHQPLTPGQTGFSLFSSHPGFNWKSFHDRFTHETGNAGSIRSIENHALEISSIQADQFKAWLRESHPDVNLISVGRSIEMFKDEGLPEEISRRYHFTKLSGSHAVGHTRMATESAVSPAHAHPYTAGQDFCLVHNGSLSNPYSVRRKLERKGIAFETDNDTEAGCRFLEWRMREGDTLEQAIETSFSELDGFFTFLMATADRMVLVRDAFACKPAVVAETDDYVAVASEFRSLAHLPGIKTANVFEPAPEQIYSWTL